MIRALITPLAAIALIGCATTGGGGRTGVDVTRYHLNQPIPPGTIAVEPLATSATISPEYQTYAGGVASELARLGFPVAGGVGQPSQYVAAVGFNRSSRGTVRTPPKFSIGIGGGSFGRGGGLGGQIGTGIGSTTREVLVSELFVQLRRRSDGAIVWEGNAQTGGLSGRDDTQPGVTANRLAAALFKGFPGESGITTTVR